ncbi:MAG: hypothetical protein IH919_06430 [Deltaproteobacteria bacterium]|nr:hypothetical protein [Deltaproteobacteria bacterium]
MRKTAPYHSPVGVCAIGTRCFDCGRGKEDDGLKAVPALEFPGGLLGWGPPRGLLALSRGDLVQSAAGPEPADLIAREGSYRSAYRLQSEREAGPAVPSESGRGQGGAAAGGAESP